MLGITSIPAVYLLYKGNVIDNFVGLPDSRKLDSFFEAVSLLRGIGHDEKVIQSLLAGSDEYMSKGIYDRAENMLIEANSHTKWKKKYGHIIKLGLAICSFNKNDYALTEKLVKELKQNSKNEINSDKILSKKLSLLELRLIFKSNPEFLTKTTDDIYKQIENDPADLKLRQKLAIHQFENSDYENAIETLLEMIKIGRNWNDKTAQKFLIHIFNFLGSDNKLTIEGRKELTKILY